MSKRSAEEIFSRNVRARTEDNEEFDLDADMFEGEPEFTLDAELFQGAPTSSAEAAALPTPPLPRPFAVLDNAGRVIAQNNQGVVHAVPVAPPNNTAFINRHAVPQVRPNQNFVNTVPRLNPQLRQQLAYVPEDDEVVLTSLLIFGAFYDAGFPTEIVRLLAQTIIDVQRCHVAMSYYFLPPGVFYNFQPIYACSAADKPEPLTLVRHNSSFGDLECYDLCDHPSLELIDFYEFIDLVFNNVCQLLEAKRTIEILDVKLVTRIKKMVAINYPGIPFFISCFNPSIRGAHTSVELPVVEFNLLGADRKATPSFAFHGLNMRTKKAYITVAVGAHTVDNNTVVGPGISSFDGERTIVANPAFGESPGTEFYRLGYRLTLPNRMTFNLSTSFSPDRFTFIVSSFDKETTLSKKF